MEKWNDKKDLNLPYLCLVGEWKCGRTKIFFVCLRNKKKKKKKERIENRIFINLLICPY